MEVEVVVLMKSGSGAQVPVALASSANSGQELTMT